MPYDFMERVDFFRIVPVLTVANNIRSITRFYGSHNIEEVIEAIVKFCDRLQTITSSSSLLTALTTQLLAKLRDLRFVYLCEVIRSYLKDIFTN